MKTLLILVAALCCQGAALASEQLARDKQCMGCHDMKKDSGAAPSFLKIAKFWKGRAGAQQALEATISKGSAGTNGPHWNKATMPDQAERPLVSQDEAKLLAKWVLSL